MNRFESEIKMELSPFRQRVRALVQEFRKVLTEQKNNFSPSTDALVFLSGPRIDNSGTPAVESSLENISRIALSKAGLDQLMESNKTKGKEGTPLPDVVINAATEQIQGLKELCLEAGIPEERIKILDCGNWGSANTKTQFEVWINYAKQNNKKHPVFISSSYHVPRISRTAAKILPQEMDFEIAGASLPEEALNVFRVVRGEIGRIIKYSEKGDISMDLPDKK